MYNSTFLLFPPCIRFRRVRCTHYITTHVKRMPSARCSNCHWLGDSHTTNNRLLEERPLSLFEHCTLMHTPPVLQHYLFSFVFLFSMSICNLKLEVFDRESQSSTHQPARKSALVTQWTVSYHSSRRQTSFLGLRIIVCVVFLHSRCYSLALCWLLSREVLVMMVHGSLVVSFHFIGLSENCNFLNKNKTKH